ADALDAVGALLRARAALRRQGDPLPPPPDAVRRDARPGGRRQARDRAPLRRRGGGPRVVRDPRARPVGRPRAVLHAPSGVRPDAAPPAPPPRDARAPPLPGRDRGRGEAPLAPP